MIPRPHSEAVAQYRLAAKYGTRTDKCVRAGLAAESYIQAQDEEQYRHWKAIEGMDCLV